MANVFCIKETGKGIPSLKKGEEHEESFVFSVHSNQQLILHSMVNAYHYAVTR